MDDVSVFFFFFLRDRHHSGFIFIGGLLWLFLFVAKLLIGPLGLGLHWTRGPDGASSHCLSLAIICWKHRLRLVWDKYLPKPLGRIDGQS